MARVKKKKMAIVSRLVSGVTGTTTTILEHNRRFVEEGWEVHVYGEKVAGGKIAAAGGEPHVMPRFPIGSFFKRRLFAWMFEREVRSEGFDLIRGHGDTLMQDVLCLHNCVHAAHEAVHGKRLGRTSGVGRIHSKMLHEQKFKLLIANSDLMRRDLVSRYGISEGKIKVVHPGHDAHKFNAETHDAGISVRQELGIAPKDVHIGLITSGDFQKRGVGLFLSALRRLDEKIKRKLKILIIGQESRLGPYKNLAQQTGLGERIRFLAPEKDIWRYFHSLDIYVHPALFEEFGQSVQEAMACGVPVLTSRRVGASELLKGEAQRILLEAPTESALADSITRLVSEPAMRRAWAQWCLAAARANTWDVNFKKHSRLYADLAV